MGIQTARRAPRLSAGASLVVTVSQPGYTSNMESTSSRNVNDLPASERQAIEGMLGQPLSPDQRVFIMAYTPGAVPDKSAREPE